MAKGIDLTRRIEDSKEHIKDELVLLDDNQKLLVLTALKKHVTSLISDLSDEELDEEDDEDFDEEQETED